MGWLEMCGIAGIYTFEQRCDGAELRRRVEAMDATLRHRGPDSTAIWIDTEAGIGLGHTRLAIRELSPLGDQPMISSCGRFVIVYNGEVYSNAELSSDLKGVGRTLKGHSDTEAMLEACAEWGVERSVTRFIGMFAFALFDRKERELYLVRDRLGKKPLYWGILGGRLLFGSELKALRAVDGWTPELDRDALASFMRHNYIPAPHTIYKGIHKLEPGCMLRISADGVPKLTRYWSARSVVESGIRETAAGDEQELLAEFDGLLRDAVQRRMISDVPLGSLLSGGVDSSLVTALMAEQSRQPINTFSIGFLESEYDEAPYARQIAAHLGTHHTELYVEPGHALEIIPKLSHWYDEPFADSSQIPTILVCELTRRYVTVVLSGDGGDEVFAGYSRYQTGLNMWGKAEKAPSPLRNAFARALLHVPPVVLDRCLVRLPGRRRSSQRGTKLHEVAKALLHDDPDAMYRQMLSHWLEPDAMVLQASETKGILWDKSVARSIPNLLDRMQFYDSVTYLPDDILVKVDRASMSVSLETRSPLLDHRVFEQAWRLPRRMKFREGVSKWILRQALYRRVPRELVERPKMGFGVPIDHWLRGPLREWAENLLDEKRLTSQGLLTPAPIRERWKAHLEGANWAYPLWNVLMLQAWLDANPGVSW
ncbi:MAG TPA: asparagine synthase (glutamine-hydrolyzing) [Gammaproteobacteria bacterium]|nr:asparagine synthase (glutamine-hydrolyzing) [Gammaproteobacteria bacterium]